MPKQMEIEGFQTLHAHVLRSKPGVESEPWRRQCGCLKTSDKLKELLKTFPTPPPPPSPADEQMLRNPESNPFDVNRVTVSKCMYPSFNSHNDCISAFCTHHQPIRRPPLPKILDFQDKDIAEQTEEKMFKKSLDRKSWSIVYDLVQLIQLSVTATALALYYLIYCYMQLVYYTLRSALYFHNADGPMKVTIGVVTITSVIVGFNLLLRMERLIGVF